MHLFNFENHRIMKVILVALPSLVLLSAWVVEPLSYNPFKSVAMPAAQSPINYVCEGATISGDKDLQIAADKKPRFLMVAGGMVIQQGITGGMRPAHSLIYVVEITTGQAVAYLTQWNSTAWKSGGQVVMTLVPVDKAMIRQVISQPGT